MAISESVMLTLLIGMFLVFKGLFRILAAIPVRYPNRGWLLNGLIGLMLGLFVGIQMIFNGWSLVILSLAAKNLPNGDEMGGQAPQ